MISIEEQAIEVAFWWSGLQDPEYPIEQLGELSGDLCKRLRALAISQLLQHGNSDAFFHNLIRSGKVRRDYLSKVTIAAAPLEYYRCSARYDALLDAIAANEFSLATEIVSLSPAEIVDGLEYPDDYFYAQGIHCLILGDAGLCQKFIERFDLYLAGDDNPRRDLLKSLATPRQSDFEEAFRALIQDREREINANIARGQFADHYVSAARNIFVEGLAVLRLADKCELRTDDEYLFCPSIARVPMTQPFPGE